MPTWLICDVQKALYMPDFEGQNFKKEKIHTTDMLHGKISLMSFVLAQYAEVRYLTSEKKKHNGKSYELVTYSASFLHSNT
jgi:ATP10 protein